MNKTNKNTTIHNLFLYFKNLHALKIRSISREDVDLFYCEEKFRSTSREDANLFFFFLTKRVIHMQIIDIQESDYNNYIKKIML